MAAGGGETAAALATVAGAGVSGAGAFAVAAGGARAGAGVTAAGGASTVLAGAGIGGGAVSAVIAGFGFAGAFLIGASGARRVTAPDELEIDAAPTGGRRTIRPVRGCGGSMALRSTVTLEDDWPRASALNNANAVPNRTVRIRTLHG